MKAPAFTRREWLGLGALSLGALGLGGWLRRGQALGEDVSDIHDTAAMAAAPGFPAIGPAGASVTMLVFSDYACGVCRKVEPWWQEAVREAGDVRVVHRDWPILGPASHRAARVALATAYQGRYAPFHDRLMVTGLHNEAAMRAALTQVGGDWARMEADLAAHGDAIDALLQRTARDALQLGFAGTPGYLIGPLRIEGGASTRQFAGAISRARDALRAG